MKSIIFALLGYLAALLVIQWFIIATREPYVIQCDGGEGQALQIVRRLEKDRREDETTAPAD